jgi:ABC-type molybdate transport system substrate-binding protein
MSRLTRSVAKRAGAVRWRHRSLARRALQATLLLACAFFSLTGYSEPVEPPWNPPPGDGRNFTVPGVDNVPDLYGDIVDPQLVVFFAGNQYMVVHDLVNAFRSAHPQYQRIFVETLPPGVLAEQIEQGALIVGNLRIALKPDVYATGRSRIEQLQQQHQWFSENVDYARNRLAIMTRAGNPHGIEHWQDLARAELPVCMPNPKWEGIAVNAIIPMLRESGGDALVDRIYRQKAQEGGTLLTQIHHRQTPLWIMAGRCEAGAVWYTEAYFHSSLAAHGIGTVELATAENRFVTYTAALMKNAPHRQAGQAFLRFLVSTQGQAIYQRYGFLPPP